MSITSGLLSMLWSWLLGPLYLAVLLLAIRRAPWPVVADNRGLQHLFLGATVLLIAMWSMRAGISPGLSVHFLGMTALTLVLGWDLAVLSGSLVLVAMTLLGRESWDGFMVNGVCLVVVPVLLTFVLHRLVEQNFPRNFFVYLFLTGFLGAACVTAISGVLMGAVLWLDGVYSWQKIHHEYVRYLPLIMFPEALMNGIIMTGVMVFYPDWVRTFDARIYIDEQ